MEPTPAPLPAALEASSGLCFVSDVCGALKKLKRTGWVVSGVPLPESDADHMHRAAMCALLVGQPPDPRDDYEGPNARFHPDRVDCQRLLRMAVTHDLCEALAGDITPNCPAAVQASKHEKEGQAMAAIRAVVGDPLGAELYGLWAEYEAQETTEALLCKDIDKFEMVVQAFEYERDHLRPRPDGVAPDADSGAGRPRGAAPPAVADEPMRRFWSSTSATIQSPLFRRLDAELRARREAMLRDKGWAVCAAEQQKPKRPREDPEGAPPGPEEKKPRVAQA